MQPWLLIPAWYALMSVISFVAYWRDKRLARKGARRTRERTLLLLDLLGGWPGGLCAQRIIRHKTRDKAFQVRFIGVVLVHVAIWLAIARLGFARSA